MDRLVEVEVERAHKRLKSGEEPRVVIQQLANNLSKKFTHDPSEQLTRNDQDGALNEAVRRLFKLDR